VPWALDKATRTTGSRTVYFVSFPAFLDRLKDSSIFTWAFVRHFLLPQCLGRNTRAYNQHGLSLSSSLFAVCPYSAPLMALMAMVGDGESSPRCLCTCRMDGGRVSRSRRRSTSTSSGLSSQPRRPGRVSLPYVVVQYENSAECHISSDDNHPAQPICRPPR
jgi:hypothetical protein